MANFDIAFKKVIVFEGGYINDKNDSGGETKFGISKISYPNINIRELTLNNAKEIYKENYWNKINGNEIKNQDIANNIFDCAVNCGVYVGSVLIQKVLVLKQDGIIGNITLGSINRSAASCVVDRYKKNRVEYYIDICIKKKQNKKFFFGWVKRAMEI